MPNHIPLEVGPLEAEVHHATLGVAYAIVDLLYRYLLRPPRLCSQHHGPHARHERLDTAAHAMLPFGAVSQARCRGCSTSASAPSATTM